MALEGFFRPPGEEADLDAALALLRGVASGAVALVQPPYFVAEMSAMLAREAPAGARAMLADLLDIEMRIAESQALYDRAMALSMQFGHHLFDTLYHAVALETPAATLVTANERDWHKARHAGRTVRLAEFGRSA